MKKIVNLVLILVTIFNAVSFVFPASGYTQTKTSSPDAAAPGETVRVKIEIDGNTVQARIPIDVVLAMDRTGSMLDAFGSVSKINAAKSALKLFVDLTEDVDNVGFVSYTRPDDIPDGSNCFFNLVTNLSWCSRLHSQLTQMTSPNQTAIKNQIDSLVAEGGTSIGAGVKTSVDEILSARGRENVNKYLVLATDGMQTDPPSPYNLGFANENYIQKARANNIQIITVGIGDDVRDWYNITDGTPGNCNDCPWVAPNPGNGINCSTGQCVSGELLMKDFACQTDPQCNKNPATRLDTNPATNDLGTPRFYFYANNQTELENNYSTIIKTITRGSSYQVLDQINTNVFDGIVDGTLKVTNCISTDPLPPGDILAQANSDDTIYVVVRNVEEGEKACIEFDAQIHVLTASVTCNSVTQTFDNCLASMPSPRNFAIDASDPRYLVGYDEELPPPACEDGDADLNSSEIAACLAQFDDLTNNIDPGSIEILYTPPIPNDPWIQTDLGDVRYRKIENHIPLTIDLYGSSDPDSPGIYFSSKDDADFGSGVVSQKGWFVENEYNRYNPGSRNRKGTLSYDFYMAKLSQIGLTPTAQPGSTIILNGLTSGAHSYNGDLVINESEIQGPGEKRVLILVNGDVEIRGDIFVNQGHLLIIAATGDIRIDDNVTEINGYFSAENDIVVEDDLDVCPDIDSRLLVGGVLVANSNYPLSDGAHGGGKLVNQRDLCGGNSSSAAILVQSRLDFIPLLNDFYKTTYTKWTELQP